MYEQFTEHLVPRLFYEITQKQRRPAKRQLPNVGFKLQYVDGIVPVHVRVVIDVLRPRRLRQRIPRHYDGSKLWRLNRGFTLNGHFTLQRFRKADAKALQLQVKVSIIDPCRREHHHLPVGYHYMLDRNDWYLEP